MGISKCRCTLIVYVGWTAVYGCYPAHLRIHIIHLLTHPFIPFLFYSTELSEKASNLAASSKLFKKEAAYLNLRTSLAAKIAIGVALFLFIVFLRFWFF